MNDLTRRITVLKNCHEIMRHLNNEEAYFEWITDGVPDCPREEDFELLANKAMQDPCKPGNPREVSKEDFINLYRQAF